MSHQKHIEELIKIHIDTLQTLEKQKARFGSLHVPVHILAQIDEHKAEIEKLRIRLKKIQQERTASFSPILTLPFKRKDNLVVNDTLSCKIFSKKSDFELLIYEHQGEYIAILSDSIFNKGMSITNTIGSVATEVLEYYNLNHKEVIWIERRPGGKKWSDEFYRVDLTWSETERCLGEAQWGLLTYERVETYIGQSLPEYFNLT